MLQSLSSRTKHYKQHSLQVVCELGKAKWGLITGQHPKSVFDAIDLAEKLVNKYQLDAQKWTCTLTRIAAWELFGRLEAYIGERAKAFQAVKISIGSISECISSMDRSLLLAKYASALASRGEFKTSMVVLSEAKALYPVLQSKQASNEWVNTTGVILFDDALNRGDIGSAKQCIAQWGAIAELNPEIESQVDVKRALLLNRIGQTAKVYFY